MEQIVAAAYPFLPALTLDLGSGRSYVRLWLSLESEAQQRLQDHLTTGNFYAESQEEASKPTSGSSRLPSLWVSSGSGAFVLQATRTLYSVSL